MFGGGAALSVHGTQVWLYPAGVLPQMTGYRTKHPVLHGLAGRKASRGGGCLGVSGWGRHVSWSLCLIQPPGNQPPCLSSKDCPHHLGVCTRCDPLLCSHGARLCVSVCKEGLSWGLLLPLWVWVWVSLDAERAAQQLGVGPAWATPSGSCQGSPWGSGRP